MKQKSKVLALILAVLMTVTLFAGCGGGEAKETTAGSAGTTAPGAEETTPKAVTYDGYEFTLSGRLYPRLDENGQARNALDQEWLDELSELEDRLDITIKYMPEVDLGEDIGAMIMSSGLAGDNLCDLIWCRQNDYWPAAKAGYLLPVDGDKLKDLGLDSTDPTRWWQPVINESNAWGNNWGLGVASKYISVPTGYFVTFNKEIVASTGYDDLYKLVREKKWTWDVYLDIAKKATKDTDNDGVNDIWGTAATAWGNELTTNNTNYVDQDENGKWILACNSQNGIDALQFLYDLNFGSKTARPAESSGENRQAFADCTVAFNWANMGHLNGPGETVYNSKHDYGIVPMPMGPAATEYVCSHDDLDLATIMSTNKNLDKVVPIMNEWALIVNDTENYLDVLDDGRCRSEQDKQMMIDYIIPTFTLTNYEMNNELYDLIDGGIIEGVSYKGETPQQVLEQYGDQIQAVLDDFFND